MNGAQICELSSLNSGPTVGAGMLILTAAFSVISCLQCTKKMFVPDCVVYTVSALLFIGRGDVVAGLDTIVCCLFNPALPRRLRDVERGRGRESEGESEGESESERELEGEEEDDDLDFENSLEREEEKKEK